MKELIKKIENWAEERNLIKGSTPQKQFIKFMIDGVFVKEGDL